MLYNIFVKNMKILFEPTVRIVTNMTNPKIIYIYIYIMADVKTVDKLIQILLGTLCEIFVKVDKFCLARLVICVSHNYDKSRLACGVIF